MWVLTAPARSSLGAHVNWRARHAWRVGRTRIGGFGTRREVRPAVFLATARKFGVSACDMCRRVNFVCAARARCAEAPILCALLTSAVPRPQICVRHSRPLVPSPRIPVHRVRRVGRRRRFPRSTHRLPVASSPRHRRKTLVNTEPTQARTSRLHVFAGRARTCVSYSKTQVKSRLFIDRRGTFR